MPGDKQRVALSPLLSVKGERVSDRTLGGTYMRGGYNVEAHGGEWWTRKGEELIAARIGSTIWRWCFDVNRDLTVVCNQWYALAMDTNGAFTNLYTAAITENVTFTHGSAAATMAASTPTVDQLILVTSGFTNQVYRVAAVVGTAVTLERTFDGTTGTKACRFLDPLARTVAGTAVAHTVGNFAGGSAVVFEQLVTHAATAIHAASPALTAGNLHLVIASNQGVPVAIDLSAYLAGSVVGVRRTWFYNTALATPLQVGSDTTVDFFKARGVWAEIYKGRLFLAAATDPNGKYGSRTIWWSEFGDLGLWHTGIQGQTAAPNFKTFDGEGNAIAELKTLGDSIVIHREASQELGDITGSPGQPFVFRTNTQGIGIRDITPSNRVVRANGVHFIWTLLGPAVFDGRVTPICEDARDDLRSMQLLGVRRNILAVLHDDRAQRIYWISGQTRRHQDALPAAATKTSPAGDSYDNYIPCFVYEYSTGNYWWEDRPWVAGGGVSTVATGLPPQLLAARIDGTLVAWTNRTKGKDVDLDDPTSGTAVTVNCQVETPWLDFGDLHVKQLTEVELAMRAIDIGGGFFEPVTDISAGNYWTRCRVYGDMNELTALADFGVVYASAAAQLDSTAENAKAPPFLLTFSPRAHGRQLKLVFSNALTTAASTASYVQAPFRISDIQVEYAQGTSALPKTNLNNGFISA